MLIFVILIIIFLTLGIFSIISLVRDWDEDLKILLGTVTIIFFATLLILSIVVTCINCDAETNKNKYNLETEQYQYIIDNKIYENDLMSTEYAKFLEKIRERNIQLLDNRLHKDSLWINWFIPRNIDEYKEVILR